jgi:hypothetical protein
MSINRQQATQTTTEVSFPRLPSFEVGENRAPQSQADASKLNAEMVRWHERHIEVLNRRLDALQKQIDELTTQT